MRTGSVGNAAAPLAAAAASATASRGGGGAESLWSRTNTLEQCISREALPPEDQPTSEQHAEVRDPSWALQAPNPRPSPAVKSAPCLPLVRRSSLTLLSPTDGICA